MRIAIITCIIGLLLFGCENKIEKQKSDKIIEKLYEKAVKPDYEKIVLLSVKYNIEETVVENVIDEYLSKHDSEYRHSKEFFGDLKGEKYIHRYKFSQNYKETVNELSIEHSIPKEKLASLIIDYKIWSECEMLKMDI